MPATGAPARGLERSSGLAPTLARSSFATAGAALSTSAAKGGRAGSGAAPPSAAVCAGSCAPRTAALRTRPVVTPLRSRSWRGRPRTTLCAAAAPLRGGTPGHRPSTASPRSPRRRAAVGSTTLRGSCSEQVEQNEQDHAVDDVERPEERARLNPGPGEGCVGEYLSWGVRHPVPLPAPDGRHLSLDPIGAEQREHGIERRPTDVNARVAATCRAEAERRPLDHLKHHR